MTSFYSQVNDFAANVSPLVSILAPPFDEELLVRLNALHDALADDSAVPLVWGAESCVNWIEGQSQGELGANMNYALMCGDWQSQVQHQLNLLAQFLQDQGYTSDAEVARSLSVQAETAGDQASVVTPDSDDIWANTPDWIKVGAALAGALLVIKVFK